MIFQKKPLLADDSHEIAYLIFSKIRKDVTKLVVSYSPLVKSDFTQKTLHIRRK